MELFSWQQARGMELYCAACCRQSCQHPTEVAATCNERVCIDFLRVCKRRRHGTPGQLLPWATPAARLCHILLKALVQEPLQHLQTPWQHTQKRANSHQMLLHMNCATTRKQQCFSTMCCMAVPAGAEHALRSIVVAPGRCVPVCAVHAQMRLPAQECGLYGHENAVCALRFTPL